MGCCFALSDLSVRLIPSIHMPDLPVRLLAWLGFWIRQMCSSLHLMKFVPLDCLAYVCQSGSHWFVKSLKLFLYATFVRPFHNIPLCYVTLGLCIYFRVFSTLSNLFCVCHRGSLGAGSSLNNVLNKLKYYGVCAHSFRKNVSFRFSFISRAKITFMHDACFEFANAILYISGAAETFSPKMP